MLFVARCAQACRAGGAEQVHAVATHGAFVADANEQLAAAALQRIVITDTIPPVRVRDAQLEIVPTAPLLAEAIRRLHEGGAVEELLDVWPV